MTLRVWRPWPAIGVLLVLAAGLPPVPAFAQPRDLPPEVITATQPTPEQQQQIRQLAQLAGEDMASGDPARVRRGREAVQSALTPQTSVAVRTTLGDALVPHLERIAASNQDLGAINALVLAGDLATPPSLALLERLRTDQRPGVRYSAVYGLRVAIETIGSSTPAVGPEHAMQIVQGLADGLAKESSREVLDAYVRALAAAARLNQARFESVAPEALRALTRAIGARFRRLDLDAAPDMLAPLIRGGEVVRDELAAAGLRRNLPADIVRDAAGTGGDALAYVFHRLRTGNGGADERPIITAVALGENIVLLARDQVGQGAVPVQAWDFAGMLQRPDGERQFVDSVWKQVIGPGGVLTQPPFNVGAERFGR